MKTLSLLLLALLNATPALADPTVVAGTWLSGNGDGLIEIRVDGTDLSALILGSPNEDPDCPTTDIHNPDPALRDRLRVVETKALSARRPTRHNI